MHKIMHIIVTCQKAKLRLHGDHSTYTVTVE